MNIKKLKIQSNDFEIEAAPERSEEYQRFCIIIQHIRKNDEKLAVAIMDKILNALDHYEKKPNDIQQQIIQYCLTVTAHLIRKGALQQYEQEIFPCVDTPLRRSTAKGIENLVDAIENEEILL